MHCSGRIVLVVMFSLAIQSFSANPDSLQNSPPRLLNEPLIEASPALLKRGLWGSATVEVAIDTSGKVDSCHVLSEHPRFANFIKQKVNEAQFQPAIENGEPESCIATFDINIPFDSLLEQCLRLPPTISGIVLDSVQSMPINNARILLTYTDTTMDSAVAIGFNHYLALVAHDYQFLIYTNQLTTTTDSLGAFSFKLLPFGKMVLSIQCAGYKARKYKVCVKDSTLFLKYHLTLSDELRDNNGFEVTVYGNPPLDQRKVIISEEENKTGFSPFLSTVIKAKAEVRQVPEGPSKMLVRSGSPYDNRYVIAGVSMLAPFHFGGHPYADIDGLMISALRNVEVTLNGVSGIRENTSGCIVKADPGKITYDHSENRGLYFKGDFSSLGLDFMTAYTSKNNMDDYLQIGFSACNDYFVEWNKYFYQSVAKGNYGIGIPSSYGNLTLTGVRSSKDLHTAAFGWLAWDSYHEQKGIDKQKRMTRDSLVYFQSADPVIYPWGSGSLMFSFPSKASISIGGAHQFFGNGKQHRSEIYSTRTKLSNIELTADFDTLIHYPVATMVTGRIQHNRWDGFLSQLDTTTSDTLCRSSGAETGLHISTSLVKNFDKLISRVNVLASVYKDTDSIQYTADEGASLSYETDAFHAALHIGHVTSRPDIRGIPDSIFKKQINHTYLASLPLLTRFNIVSRFGIQPYIRYCTGAPQLDPIRQIWDPDLTSPLLAYGADIDIHLSPVQWADFSGALNISDARRWRESSGSTIYEWNIPWTIRNTIHLKSKNDRYNFYINYIRTKGLPYFDIENQNYNVLPVYRSLDINFQIHTSVPHHQFIKFFDVYIALKNIQDLINISNVRDYYWDSNGHRMPIYLGYGRIDTGARFGFKL